MNFRANISPFIGNQLVFQVDAEVQHVADSQNGARHGAQRRLQALDEQVARAGVQRGESALYIHLAVQLHMCRSIVHLRAQRQPQKLLAQRAPQRRLAPVVVQGRFH